MLLRWRSLHCVIPGGALSPDRTRWISAPKGFLFPVRALSIAFRKMFIRLIEQTFHAGNLQFPGKTSAFQTTDGFSRLLRQVRTKPWIVYSKPSFAGPKQVLDYLGRYTHRVAISNHRITDLRDGRVTFAYRDRKSGAKKTCALSAPEFIRRFLLHVLPTGYVRIRHFGFLASRAKAKDLERCRQLLGVGPPAEPPPEMSSSELLLDLTGSDITACPHCAHGTMRFLSPSVRILQSPSPHSSHALLPPLLAANLLHILRSSCRPYGRPASPSSFP